MRGGSGLFFTEEAKPPKLGFDEKPFGRTPIAAADADGLRVEMAAPCGRVATSKLNSMTEESA